MMTNIQANMTTPRFGFNNMNLTSKQVTTRFQGQEALQPGEKRLSGGEIVSAQRFTEVRSLVKSLVIGQNLFPDRKAALETLWRMIHEPGTDRFEGGSTSLKQLGLMGAHDGVDPTTLAMVKDFLEYDPDTKAYSISEITAAPAAS